MRKGIKRLNAWFENLKLRSKLMLIYILGMLVPLVLTDGVILNSMMRISRVRQEHEMENVAKSVYYNIISETQSTISLGTSIYLDDKIRSFLNTSYETNYDYYAAYRDFVEDSFFESVLGITNKKVTIYADNPTIVNGGCFGDLNSITKENWYQDYIEQDSRVMMRFYYDENIRTGESKRKFICIRNLNKPIDNDIQKVLKVEIDYANLLRSLERNHYSEAVYLCHNGMVMLDNQGESNLMEEYYPFTHMMDVGYTEEFSLYGEDFQIFVLRDQNGAKRLSVSNLWLIMILIVFNIVLPWMMIRLIEQSVIKRILILRDAFNSATEEELQVIDSPISADELGVLMLNYNHMALRTNELVQTVYKERLKEQETDIARQNAELLALHSQINPHFLFNSLESIRMHSILKGEHETASMVEKLALMERQNANWSDDMITTEREMMFVEAYLGLQKYRFGDRLSFDIVVEPACKKVLIPKLSIVTFVENACVHGVESKAGQSWLFVNVHMEGDMYCIEVEDSGSGMDEATLADIRDKMEHASIERLKEKGRIGILNSVLRLKMMTQNQVRFSIESEEGVGTFITILFPIATTTVEQ